MKDDEAKRYYTTFTREDCVSVVVRGVIRATVPGDSQAHAEVTVGGAGNLLTVEVNGTFIDVLLPKGYGVYHK